MAKAEVTSMQMKPRHLAARRSIEIRERKEHAFRLCKLKENLPRHAKKKPPKPVSPKPG